MTMKKRTFTKEEKLNIIKEASEKGITETYNAPQILDTKLS